MKRFRFKLTLIFILFMALSVIGLGMFTVKNLKETHIETLQEGMLREIRLIVATVPWPANRSMPEQIDYFERQAEYLKPFAGSRVTFIDNTGVVLGDSDHDATRMDNHINRPEIRQAIERNGPGYSIRFSDTVKREMLNVVVPVEQDGERVGFLRLGMNLTSVEQAVQRLWSYYLLGLVLLFLLSVLISYWISRSLTRPLEHITRVAQQITDANYRSRVKIKNRDEIGKLGDAINTMADSLQSQMNRIAENESRLKTVLENLVSGVVMINRDGEFVLMNKSAEVILGIPSRQLLGQHYTASRQQHKEFTEIIADGVEKRERIRDEIMFYYPEERTLEINLVPLKQGTEWSGVVIVLHDITAIRRLEKMRSEFVANVSHELKTPIASVKGFAETLLAGAVEDKETAQSFLQIIYDESERLNRLILDILDLSKIESKQTPLHFSPIEMKSFVEKTLHMMKSEAGKKNIRLEMDVGEDLYIEADEDRLRQVLINLLSNGINYTSEGGRVKVEVFPLNLSSDPAEDKMRIRISDTGIGIPKKDLPRIFERFYRVDKARSRRSGGTGLGLSIVKHIVELHRGDISVESEVGIGSTFSIDLPVIQ